MKLASLLFLIALVSATPSASQELRIVTEEFPPYDFTTECGSVAGLSTDVVREVLGDLGLNPKIEVFPWARAYKLALQQPSTMLFSVVRTKEREPLFHWVGVVCDVKSYLFKLKSRSDIPSTTLSDLKDYSVGVVRGWAGETYLADQGFERLQRVAISDHNIKKLFNGRVDLIEDYEASLIYRIKQLGLDPNMVEKVHFNAEISGQLYAVFSKTTEDHLVQAFQDAFSVVHGDGRYDAIQRKWLEPD